MMSFGLYSLALCLTIGLASASITCDDVKATNPSHTLCLADSPVLISSGVSIDDKIAVTGKHNALRGAVEPAATDLIKLVWDDKLEAVAQKLANQCKMYHDAGSDRIVPGVYTSVGQNVAAGQTSWEAAIQAWYSEIKDFKYGQTNDYRVVGHFTQIVQRTTYLVGCGYAKCNDAGGYSHFYVCNYVGANYDVNTPYTSGTRCSECQTCDNGVCDCGGRVCHNGGKINLKECTCTCPSQYSGDSCETYTPTTTPAPFTSKAGCTYTGVRYTKEQCKSYGEQGADMWPCMTNGGSYTCDHCKKYNNIKFDYCPVMCGICDKQ